jgi:type 1 glutamine amidotransferase
VSEGLPETFMTADRSGRAALPTGARTLAADEAGQPLVWAAARGRGRMLASTLGADPAVLDEPVLRQIVERGLEWAAAGAVSVRQAWLQERWLCHELPSPRLLP